YRNDIVVCSGWQILTFVAAVPFPFEAAGFVEELAADGVDACNGVVVLVGVLKWRNMPGVIGHVAVGREGTRNVECDLVAKCDFTIDHIAFGIRIANEQRQGFCRGSDRFSILMVKGIRN